MSAVSERTGWFLVVISLWVIAYVSQINYDSWRFYSPGKISVTYNEFIEPQPLSQDAAKIASFGSTELLANYYWLSLIQYYGGGTPYGEYRKLAELFQTITELAPRFKQPYVTGLVILPGEGFPDEALKLGRKGQENLPDSWEIPYYTGLTYHIYKKDFAKAGEEFIKASKFADAPVITKLMAGVYFKEANERKKSYLIFQTVIETSDDEFIVKKAENYLIHLDGIFALEAAVKKFQQRFDRLPDSLNELVERQIINTLPVSPLPIKYDYNSKTGAITEVDKI